MAQHDLLSRATECGNETLTMQQVIVVTDTVHVDQSPCYSVGTFGPGFPSMLSATSPPRNFANGLIF